MLRTVSAAVQWGTLFLWTRHSSALNVLLYNGGTAEYPVSPLLLSFRLGPPEAASDEREERRAKQTIRMAFANVAARFAAPQASCPRRDAPIAAA